MDQTFCRFGQVQLQMTAKTGVVIEYGQHNRTVPFAFCVENTDFCLVIIQVPKAMNIGDFETTNLTVLASQGGLSLPIGRLRRSVRF